MGHFLRSLRGIFWVGTLACAPAVALAQGALQDPRLIQESARTFLQQIAQERATELDGTARIEVGAPDPHLRLAACADLQPSLPPGARRSGRTLVAVRCLDGRPWQIFLPAEIHVEAPVWLTSRALPGGEVIAPQDVTQGSVEIGSEEGDMRALSVARGVAIGQTLARPLPAGVVLHISDLRDLNRVAPGDNVDVVYSGLGFRVSGEGRTVNAASPGQTVQVRMASGTMVSGILLDNRVVEIRI